MTSLNIVSGPGKYEFALAAMYLIDPTDFGFQPSVRFTDKEGHTHHARITGLSRAKNDHMAEYVEIEGFLTQGVSPYRLHGIEFRGRYKPIERHGWLELQKAIEAA